MRCVILSCGKPNRDMKETDVRQGTLALMVLKTLDVLGRMHGYGIARRIEQISGDLLTVNQGTLYPVLLKLEQEGSIASEWGSSENNRKARFYRLTRGGRKQLQAETRSWEQTAAITITAILTLALGIGATTSIFTLVHAVLLKSLPVANPGDLYRLGKEAPGAGTAKKKSSPLSRTICTNTSGTTPKVSRNWRRS